MARTTPRASTRIAPMLTRLTPSAAPLGAPSFTLHVHGTGFVEGDVILWNDAPEPTTFVSDNQLTTGVNMATAQVVMPIPVSVQTVEGDISNVLTFALGEELPPLTSVPVVDGVVLMLDDANGRPMLVRAEEIVGVEEAYDPADPTGPLYGKNAGPYRRLTLRGGAQFYIATGNLPAVVKALNRK